MAKTGGRTYSFNELAANIRARRFAPIYLLQGEEPYFIDKLVDLLNEYVVSDEEARDFDRYNFFGADADIRTILDTARQFPIMGNHRLVVLREAQSMNNARNEIEKLAPYTKTIVNSTVLVICWKSESIKANGELIKGIKSVGGVVYESAKVKEWNLNSHITEYCKDKKVKIDNKALEMLKEYIGTDLSRMFGEIDKLIVATNRAPITPESIEKNIGISKDYNNFELINAIASRNYTKAMRIVDYFSRNPKQNPVIVCTSMLFRFFSSMMLAHYASDKSERGLMQHLGFHSPYQLKDISLGLTNYSARSCFSIIHALRILDCKSKGIGSMQQDFVLLKEFVYQVFTL